MTHTLVQHLDFGPALTIAEVDTRLRVALWKGIRYYIKHGTGDAPYPIRDARILSVEMHDEPSGITGFRARRIEAQVEFL